MPASSPKDYQVLLDRPRGVGMVVSCYADTSVAEGFEPHWRPHLKAEATRIRGLLAGDPGALEEFERQLETIRGALESPSARHAPGMAVFAASGWDEALALASDEPYEDRLVVDEGPYLVPLIAADYRCREYLVVLTDTHRGRLFAANPGAASLVDELDEARPGTVLPADRREAERRTDDAGRRDERVLRYLKELARRVERAWDARDYRGIILLGEHEVLGQFRGVLPKRLAARVAHEAPHAWAGRQPEIRDEVREAVDAAIAGRRGRLLAELDGRLRRGFAAATGPREVIVALDNGQVIELVLGPDPGEAASRCSGCGTVFATEESACPYCKAPCARTNLWQEILARAVRQGVAVHFVPAEARTAVPGGAAALLARDEPQWDSHRPDACAVPEGLT